MVTKKVNNKKTPNKKIQAEEKRNGAIDEFVDLLADAIHTTVRDLLIGVFSDTVVKIVDAPDVSVAGKKGKKRK